MLIKIKKILHNIQNLFLFFKKLYEPVLGKWIPNMMKDIHINKIRKKNRMLAFIIQTSLEISNLCIKKEKVRYKFYKGDQN